MGRHPDHRAGPGPAAPERLRRHIAAQLRLTRVHPGPDDTCGRRPGLGRVRGGGRRQPDRPQERLAPAQPNPHVGRQQHRPDREGRPRLSAGRAARRMQHRGGRHQAGGAGGGRRGGGFRRDPDRLRLTESGRSARGAGPSGARSP
ncbi:hypothetical protein SGPA1_10373 [Streptomyces misionensis JCM 4497]